MANPPSKLPQNKTAELLRPLLDRGNAALIVQNYAEAVICYREAIKLAPNMAKLHYYLGASSFNLRNYDEAISALANAYNLDPSDAEVVRVLCNALIINNRHADAEPIIRAHYLKNTSDAGALTLLLACFRQAEKWAEIVGVLNIWLANNNNAPYPNLACYANEQDALVALGEPLKALEKLEAIEPIYGQDPEYWPVMGHMYGVVRNFERELEMHKKAYDHTPSDPRPVSNYGIALSNLNRMEDAIALFNRALEVNHLLANIYVNRAYSYKKLGRLDDAIADIKKALEIAPTSPGAHYALGCAYVQNEDYASGWPHYEWNWHQADMPKFRPTDTICQWYGEDLAGKHLLVHVEQGIGDTIMFARYIPEIIARYKDVSLTVICEGKLLALLQHSLPQGITYLVKEDLQKNAPIAADFMVSFGSLPVVFNTTIHDVPAKIPYLAPHKTLNYKTTDTDIVIGLSWYTRSMDAGYKRSLELESFSFLKDLKGVRVIDLQYGDTTEARAKAAAIGLNIIHDDTVDAWNDMQAHIDQIAACDLIISVDNTTVHAAGALGKPVWTLLPCDSYWRWHNDHTSTPWYPTMRLFRQGQDRNFAPVLDAIRTDVTKLASGDTSVLTPAPFVTRFKPQADKRKKAVLINDTSTTYHWGCTATSEALKHEMNTKGYDIESVTYLEINSLTYPAPSLQDFDTPIYLSEFRFRDPTLFDAIAKADVVVINGEGTIHGTNPNALRLLYFAYIAKTAFKKPVHIINHACFPEDGATLTNPAIVAFYLKGYRAADYVSVRDKISHQLLTSLGINATLAFDSLPLTAKRWLQNAKPESRGKDVILAGSSYFLANASNAYKAMLADLIKEGYSPYVLIGAKIAKASEDTYFCNFIDAISGGTIPVVESHSMDDWFERLQSAALLVSGRFHYSIAAACLGTPFVAFEGNTPKLEALCALLKEKTPLGYTDPDLTMKLRIAITKALRDGPKKEDERKQRLDELCDLAMKNFAALK